MLSRLGASRRLVLARMLGACVATAVGLGVGSAPAAAETLTFGSHLPAPTPGYYDSCSVACTSAQLGLPGTQLVAPVSGTITSFRLRTAAGSDPQQLRFRVLRSADGSKFTGAGTSAAVPISTAAGITEYPVNMAVKAGDVIGFDQSGGGLAARVIAVNPGAFQAAWFPTLGDGATPKPSDNPQGSDPTRYELLLQAEVEFDPSAQFGCTDPKTFEASCADSNGLPSVCGPSGTIFPQCNLPFDLPAACSGTGTGLPTCSLPGNYTVACGSLGISLPVCDLPPPEIPQVCGPTTVGLAPCAGANNAVLACGPTSLGFPPCAFKTLVKAPKPLGLDGATKLNATLSCPDGAIGDDDSCDATVDIMALTQAKINALLAEAEQLSDRFANSRTEDDSYYDGDEFGELADAAVNAERFFIRSREWTEFYLAEEYNSNFGEEPLRFLPLSPTERARLIDDLRQPDRAHEYTGPPDLYDNAFTFSAIVTMVNSIDAALTDLYLVQKKAAKGSGDGARIRPAPSAALAVAARRASDPNRPQFERRLKLRRDKRTRVRLKLSRKVVRALVKLAPRKAPVVPARLVVSFDAEPRPIVRFVDFPLRIKAKKPKS